jgi:thymidylate synthase (FAD)
VDTKEGTYTEYEASPDEASCDWLNVMYNIEGIYRKLRNAGWKPEQARSILPNSLKTELVMTANFREWRHFFKLRTAKAAHPQMREVAILLLMGFQKSIPIIFDDIKVPQ